MSQTQKATRPKAFIHITFRVWHIWKHRKKRTKNKWNIWIENWRNIVQSTMEIVQWQCKRKPKEQINIMETQNLYHIASSFAKSIILPCVYLFSFSFVKSISKHQKASGTFFLIHKNAIGELCCQGIAWINSKTIKSQWRRENTIHHIYSYVCTVKPL